MHNYELVTNNIGYIFSKLLKLLWSLMNVCSPYSSTVLCSLRYHEPNTALQWLCVTLGVSIICY